MAKTYTLKTKINEVIDYDNITVEVKDTKNIPSTTETTTETYTPKTIQDKIDGITQQITSLTAEKTKLETIQTKILTQANNVTSAIKKVII